MNKNNPVNDSSTDTNVSKSIDILNELEIE